MNIKQLTFLVLNGLLNGKDLKQIGSALNTSEADICSVVGLNSYQEYTQLFTVAKEHYDLKDEEKVILNFLSIPEYVFSLLDTGDEKRFYGYETLQSIAASPSLNLDVIPSILLEFLPTIKLGKSAKAVDGCLYLHKKYINSETALNNLLIDCFCYHFYGKPILTKKQAKLLIENMRLDQAPTITPKALHTVLKFVAEKGYKLSAVNDLLRIALYDYVDSYALTGTVLEYRGEDNIRMLIYEKSNNTNSGTVILIPAQILPKLANSPRLFEESYIENGYIYVKTNVGYKQLIFQDEVVV